MTDFDKLGSFYLGRKHDLATGQSQSAPLLYESDHLTTHAVCVGMTGSGKTGLCITLLEEAALDGIPAIAIDPKGDLGNLMLAFPKLETADFRPWIDPSEAARRQLSPDEFAASQAKLWRDGLAEWDEDTEQIRRYCDAVERAIYTPGSSAGIPITVLKSFHAPPLEIIQSGDDFNERVASAVSGLLALLGIDVDPVRSREHIFLSNLFTAAWRAGRDLDLQELIQQIERPPITTVGVMDLETFYPAADRHQLSMSLNSLLASPTFAAWMHGEPLDIERLLYTRGGKPRLAIMSIAHLDDAQRMFFVTMLLNEVISWMRSQPGTSSLRALLYMDEVFGYFPPLANPPSKRPMLTLLKQARAYGLGCVLATQNPVDLDYKGLSNAGTWFLGRLQTERDKARVIEGLEGASVEAGANFSRPEMEARLAALGNRVFLMNNVHENAPVVFHTRWAMSYLSGPLTREQIKMLMDPVRAQYATGTQNSVASKATVHDGESKSPPQSAIKNLDSRRPILPVKVTERFAVAHRQLLEGDQLEYRPALLGKGKVHFVSKSDGVDVWQDATLLQEIRDALPNDVWNDAGHFEQEIEIGEQPKSEAQFHRLPSELARETSYTEFARELRTHLYREQSLNLWNYSMLGETSQPNETEQAFRARLKPMLEARLREERRKLEQSYEKKLADVEVRIAQAQSRVKTQRWQFFTRVGQAAWVIADTVISATGRGLPGRRRSLSPALTSAATEKGQQTNAQLALDKLVQEKTQLDDGYQAKLSALASEFSSSTVKLERIELKPQKSDIEVDGVILLWLPWRVDASGNARPMYEVDRNPAGVRKLSP
jgi:hypothetical protein